VRDIRDNADGRLLADRPLKEVRMVKAVPILALALCVAAPAAAQTRGGIRGGVSGDPTQFFIGGHLITNGFAKHVTFRPNAELGVGDGGSLLAINIEFAYNWPLRRHPWTIYAGAGPGLIIASCCHDHPDEGGTNVGGGFNIFIGADHRKGFMTELKVGIGDSPAVKVTIGYTFH
jgi:hypothetical protein